MINKSEIIKIAWNTFELKGICEKLRLYPNEKGELIKHDKTRIN